MKNDWLTIPIAPNYEINSDLVCRNKRRNRIIAPCYRRGKRSFRVCVAGKQFCRSAQYWRTKAEEALLDEPEFFPVPSLGGKYEINKQGVLRHAVSHSFPTLLRGCYRVLDQNFRRVQKSRNSLLLEVFGETPSKHRVPMPVICSKGNQCFYFDNKIECARFLADKLFFDPYYVAHRLHKHVDEFHGWKITYLDSGDNCYAKELSYEARRQQTLDKKTGLSC